MSKTAVLPRCPANPASLAFGPDRPWLAPLAGYSDLPFRLLCREYGAAVCVTEMVSAKGLVYHSPGTGELLASLPEDQPLVVQLFGAEADFLRRAVAMLREAGYGWFDLNMGCSVPKVLRQGAGAAMLGDMKNSLAVARAMLEEAGPGRVGFKLRLGLDDARPVLPDLALRLEDLGAGWLRRRGGLAGPGPPGPPPFPAAAGQRRSVQRRRRPALPGADRSPGRDVRARRHARSGHFRRPSGPLPGGEARASHARGLAGHDTASYGAGARPLPGQGRAVENALGCAALCAGPARRAGLAPAALPLYRVGGAYGGAGKFSARRFPLILPFSHR